MVPYVAEIHAHIVDAPDVPNSITLTVWADSESRAVGAAVDRAVKEGYLPPGCEYQVAIVQVVPNTSTFYTFRFATETGNSFLTNHGPNIGRFALSAPPMTRRAPPPRPVNIAFGEVTRIGEKK